jgi:hypothetical protein
MPRFGTQSIEAVGAVKLLGNVGEQHREPCGRSVG